MLIVETIAKIRRMYHVQNKGFKTIARELGLSKNTVKKVIKTNQTRQTYRRGEQPYRVLSAYIETLKSRLKADEKEPLRRRRTAKKLYEELGKEGYQGSYEAVNRFVTQWKLAEQSGLVNAFIPLSFDPGEAFQFDWSTEEIELAGEITRVHAAHIRLCHSRLFLVVVYPNEQLEMVMDAHDKAFAYFGGVCRQGIYDNMKTAIKKVLLGKERQVNDRFQELASHHLFEIVACTPRAGWEKGQVERQVETGRCNLFTPLRKVASLAELNEQLREECLLWAQKTSHPEQKDRTIWDVYQSEKSALRPVQAPFHGFALKAKTVSSTCLIRFDTNDYSVDCHYVRRAVEVRIHADQIRVYHKNTLVAEHERCFGRHQKIYHPWHYVPLLERKPGGLRHGAPFKGWALPSALQQVRKRLARYPDGDKQFIKLLLKISDTGLEVVNQACCRALSQDVIQAD